MREYSIGLDIGNASVGWAVINDNYQLHKFKKKNMWGVRLFEQANTAQTRRLHRSTARRLHRRRQRIYFLQSLLEPIIMEIDDSFFIRLKESFLWQEDRSLKHKHNLFIEDSFTDKDYYHQFPTIYHLRNHLINSNQKEDPRLIYLALHHLIKYRGHFIYENQDFQLDDNNIENLLLNIMNKCRELELISTNCTFNQIKEISAILKDKKLNNSKRIEQILKVLQVKKNGNEDWLFKLVVGNKCDVYRLFQNDLLLDSAGKGITVSISEDKFEEVLPLIEEALGEQRELIQYIKNLYSFLILEEILGDKSLISEAMIERYDKFHQDLSDLKLLLKKYNMMDTYYRIFKEETFDNFYGYMNYRGKKIKDKDAQTRFYNLVKKELNSNKNISNDELVKDILLKIENQSFLIPLNIKANSAIPYQLQLKELELILSNQGKYYNILLEEAEKIKRILTFKIPYYVGPLNSNSSFSWLERTDEKITPWNFEEVVDESQSAENFIKRMTNYCTYLREEPVLPSNSIIYSRYSLLNELNKIRVNGHLITQECKEYMINELFLKQKKVTKDSFVTTYETRYTGEKVREIQGFQEEDKFASTLNSERDFIKILGDVSEKNISMIENIIYWLTIFNESKMVDKKIDEYYSNQITSIQKEQILKLKYNGWGRLSNKLLTKIKSVTPTQEKISIMDCLIQTNLNFMQIINSDEYTFKEEIEKVSLFEKKEKLTYEDVDKIYGSPAIKRGVWQSIQIIQEIEKVMKNKPKNIFIEFARSDEASKRTKSRYKQLEELLVNNKDSILNYQDLMEDLKASEKELSKRKYYLYFLQLGKCMYTQEPLNINRLSDYQVDHIIPQALIKDDSLENLVLVKVSRNQDKLDYKIPLDVVKNPQEAKDWWNKLLEINMISKKKYFNLTTKEYNEEQLNRFINRQLVETRQISKEVATLLESVYPNTVITLKAKLVHDMREQFGFFKCREINDYHHAHDAYLNAVLGDYLLKKYPKLEKEFIYRDYLKISKSPNKGHKYGFIVSSMQYDSFNDETGEVIWDARNTLQEIRKALNYKDCFITKKLDSSSEFYNATIIPKVYKDQHKIQSEENINQKVTQVSLKKGLDVKKYGGYSGIQEAYFSVIEYDTGKKKNPRKKELVGIPVYVDKLLVANPNAIEEYLLNKGYKNIKFLLSKVMKNQLVETDGALVYLTSSREWNNAKQLVLDNKLYNAIYKYLEYEKNFENVQEEFLSLEKIYDSLVQKMGIQYKVFYSIAKKLEASKEKFLELPFNEQLNIIKHILLITQANATNGNLKKIGLTDRQGRLNEKTLDVEKTTFIQQSVTGMFEKRVRV